MTEMMNAWRRDTYGPAAGVTLQEIPVPVPGRGEVVLRVHATGLNAGDVHLLLGDPLLVRPVFGLTRPKHPVRGIEVSGTVVAVGRDVVGAEIGEDVVGELEYGGGLATYVRAPASRLVPIPPDVEHAVAACLPVAGGTAWQALDLAGVGLRAGRTSRILVLGASGGVGTFAVQLAALRGAEVWASCSERNARLVEHLGAVRTFDHRQSPLADLPAERFDAIIDIAGGLPLRELQRLVSPGGTIVLVGGDGGRVLGPIPRILQAGFLSIGSRRIRSFVATPRPEILAKLLELTADGRIAPVIEREYPFAKASAALAHIEAGHTVGKVVVRAE
ncbi:MULTISPECIES: NAD(P)-dependent alcohol dehydrogenase [unclassified Microbacterium]|uniref:NAD(P)-dependent alcohol dehydrogenase n=1 Tax=unclassified Microbacterium TaxID=2609290 RepID=UPI000EAA1840|nr:MULTISPECIES: NAD(P)-dependent alcohol dehydrogenase [unclassified Microbacterium]MBT2483622.1 NAD(P)-dependent alcohol dehydrogenase [Microbacterium sp. ISL-108]RKN66626.1 NAD(P)-dependent alcohol dehydrogenase [Microbacterium sp. CGR2]